MSITLRWLVSKAPFTLEIFYFEIMFRNTNHVPALRTICTLPRYLESESRKIEHVLYCKLVTLLLFRNKCRNINFQCETGLTVHGCSRLLRKQRMQQFGLD